MTLQHKYENVDHLLEHLKAVTGSPDVTLTFHQETGTSCTVDCDTRLIYLPNTSAGDPEVDGLYRFSDWKAGTLPDGPVWQRDADLLTEVRKSFPDTEVLQSDDLTEVLSLHLVTFDGDVRVYDLHEADAAGYLTYR